MAHTLGTIIDDEGPVAAVIADDRVHVVPGRPRVLDLLQDWSRSLDRLDALAADPGEGRPLDETTLGAPLPDARNLYMAGANYADHAREMGDFEDGAPVPKPEGGPFFFLKPTTTLTGPGQPVELGVDCHSVDWEVELAVVIGQRADHVPVAHALDTVAGYCVVNDVSVRDRFRRPQAPPAMSFDWFTQKGWRSSCPCGPAIVPARDVPDPQDLALSLTVNGEFEQRSRTSEMIFSVAEQLSYLSRVITLVPGDIVCTGTPAGVGMSKGRFLAPGDTVVATVEGVGTLENPVVGAA